MVTDLDALYVNFISGFELDLATAQLLHRGFRRFLYADLHSLFLGRLPDGTRIPQPLADPAAWFSCFDVVQLNDEELSQVGPDPLAVAALALGAGCRALCVTLGAQGAVVLTGSPVRSIRLAAQDSGLAPGESGDPTGCGDVLGAAAAGRLAAGASLEEAFREAVRLAARNLSARGASGLRDHLLGRLVAR
jgi:sugar/nucleoside kinase (ribokinase family)